jgi:hypothetical protein
MLLITLVGCHSSQDESRRPDVPEWHDRYNMPWEIDPTRVPFAHAAVRERFLLADKAARELADSRWVRPASVAYPYISWNSGSDGYSRTYQARWERSGRADHGVSGKVDHVVMLSTTLYDQPRNARGFQLQAEHTEKDGWTAAIRYGCNDSGSSFSLEFQHPRFLTTDDSRQDIAHPSGWGPGQLKFSASRRDDLYTYEFSVVSRGRGEGGAIYQPLGEDILPYLQSAESFRTAANAELDRLDQRVREYFASSETGEVWTYGGPTGGDSPQPAASPEAIPQAVREEVLNQAVRDISAWRELLSAHYRAMYAALAATFPCLAEVVASSPEPIDH